MLPINNSYGNASILCTYAKARRMPIWGEIQHSLWFDRPDTGQQKGLFKKIFTWNSILKIEHSIPIGDPFLYLSSESNEQITLLTKELERFVLILPKFRRAVSTEEREAHYLELIREARERFPGSEFAIKLHHGQVDYWIDRSLELKAFRDIQPILAQNFTSDYGLNESLLTKCVLESRSRILTDYLGPHVFRRVFNFGMETDLYKSNSFVYPSIDSGFKDLIESFTHNSTGITDKKSIAAIVLGVEWKRDYEELRSILGLSGWRKLCGKIVHQGYKRVSTSHK